MNRVFASGKICYFRTKEIEIKKAERMEEIEVLNFGLATIDNYGKSTNFHSCTAWGNLAKNIFKYRKVGAGIVIIGTIKSQEQSQKTEQIQKIEEKQTSIIEQIQKTEAHQKLLIHEIQKIRERQEKPVIKDTSLEKTEK